MKTLLGYLGEESILAKIEAGWSRLATSNAQLRQTEARPLELAAHAVKRGARSRAYSRMLIELAYAIVICILA